MRTYVIVAGAVFALVTVAHIWRITVEPHLIHDPWFIGITIITALLTLAAWRAVRRSS